MMNQIACSVILALGLAATAIAAAFVPALRATRVNPVTVLSADI
jgi:ABC-type lipoprotein release transport system permease subunit